MASITSWVRLEPRVRREEPDLGLQARVHDPLWFLARQWQVGEYTGEDAGSPVQVRARLDAARVTRYAPGTQHTTPGSGIPYDPARLPLEALVEHEVQQFDLRIACEAGLHFLRLLDRHGTGRYRGAFLDQYPLRPTPGIRHDDTTRLLRLAAGRAPDAVRLAADLRVATGGLPDQPSIDPGDRAAVLQAAQEWLAWLDARLGVVEELPTAWSSERMEYTFAIAAPGDVGEQVLVAPEYTSGRLDWHTFDRHTNAALGAQTDQQAREALLRTVVPMPVSYRGMPSARWWQFEDAQVNFGAVDAGPRDLLRLLLLGFALDYGNDWFLAPLELPAGGVYRITALVVTDSFGEATLVRSYREESATSDRWGMFYHAGDDGSAGGLFLPPALAAGVQGEPIEEVLLLRDEVANLAWAIERRVEDPAGRPVDRFEQYQPQHSLDAAHDEAAEAGWRYQLATSVPDYWIPLVPVRSAPEQPDIRLRRGRVLQAGSAEPAAPAPAGRILEPGRPLILFDEEVSRAGARVQRAYQYARWTGGESFLWVGRRKRPGHGEGASGLRFDLLVE